jgi:hypothetical protein
VLFIKDFINIYKGAFYGRVMSGTGGRVYSPPKKGFKRRGTLAERIVEGTTWPDKKYIDTLRGQLRSCDARSDRYRIIGRAVRLCDGSAAQENRPSVILAVFMRKFGLREPRRKKVKKRENKTPIRDWWLR